MRLYNRVEWDFFHGIVNKNLCRDDIGSMSKARVAKWESLRFILLKIIQLNQKSDHIGILQ